MAVDIGMIKSEFVGKLRPFVRKELSFCNKLTFSNPYIFAT